MCIGVEDAEEHGVPSSKAGHWHFSCLHCSQVSGFISGDILICLNATSKSKLAHRRCNSLLYLVAPLPLPICSFLQCSLTPCSSSVGAAFPRPGRLVIAIPDRNVLILLPMVVNSASATWSASLCSVFLVWMVVSMLAACKKMAAVLPLGPVFGLPG